MQNDHINLKKVVILGVGSNLGNAKNNLLKAFAKVPLIGKKIAPIIENDAILPKNAPPEWNIKYQNTVVIGYPIFDVLTTFCCIKKIEKQMKRQKSAKWAPRVIDIDILFWGKATVNINNLQIPHRMVSKRFFTLRPISDLIPLYLHTKYNINIQQMLHNYMKNVKNIKL